MDQIKTAEELLDYDADPNIAPRNMESPLDIAAEKGLADMTHRLLIHGANVNRLRFRDTGDTALYHAAKNGHAECVRILLAAGAIAIYEPAPDEPGYFIRPATLPQIAGGWKHKRAYRPREFDRWRKTHTLPFIWRAREKESYAEILRLFINAGADVSSPEEVWSGKMPLHIAVAVGNCAAVEVLLAEGANVNARTQQGLSVMCLARMMGHADVVGVLERARERKPDRRRPRVAPKPVELVWRGLGEASRA
ncbi:ankyrin repeat-containing domain protein [Aspergillus cavernicola]|uniref:Ankyrin repeat-containing domain protein n=1 Tax=Aspergillus cavernicola TaxID=176166 RepID=A0ABR4IDB0_9EURO